MAIVTVNYRKIVNKVLSHFRLKKFFQVVITREDVEKTKPHPEPIIKTMKKLGCKPDACLYIGDHEVDILAGKASGTTTVFFNSQNSMESCEAYSGADYVISRLEEILILVDL